MRCRVERLGLILRVEEGPGNTLLRIAGAQSVDGATELVDLFAQLIEERAVVRHDEHLARSAAGVSICTFVQLKQVNRVPGGCGSRC